MKIRSIFLICIWLFISIILVGCGPNKSAVPVTSEDSAGTIADIENISAAEPSEESETPETPPACEYNSDCQQDFLCIEGTCKTLSSLFETDCEEKCSISGAKIFTSDKEVYDLTMGRGSYTYAGALEWRLMKTMPYCKGEDPLVVITVIKKTTGKIIGEQVITLQEKETSGIITHPVIKGISFTMTLDSVNEQCS